jgi:RNA polymerase sigma factor (sigma-70 family)
MNKMHYTDDEILDGIKKRSAVVLEYVYEECYPLIKNLVLKNSGDQEDVQDVFQDAMVILFKKVKHNELELQCAFKTYLFSICNHLWLQKLEKRKKETTAFRNVAQTTDLTEDELIEIYDEEAEKYRIYQKHYLSLDKECQNLLSLFLKKNSIREIADMMGYKTEKYAKVKKYRCKEELKRRITNDPNYKNLF